MAGQPIQRRREGGGSIGSKIAERLSALCDSIFACLSFIAPVAETDAVVEAV